MILGDLTGVGMVEESISAYEVTSDEGRDRNSQYNWGMLICMTG